MGKRGRKIRERVVVTKKIKYPLCPDCGEHMTVIDTVNTPDEILRKRCCPKCGRLTVTVEFEVDLDNNFKSNWYKYRRQNIAVSEGV